MLQTPPKTNTAFMALLDALDAESRELQAAGQQRFHGDGDPQSARLLSHAAIERAQLRDEVAHVHAKWRANIPSPPPAPSVDRSGLLQIKRCRVARAMTHNEVAKRLGVRTEKVRTWLEIGVLKGQQLSRTKWQVDAQEVLAFARNHPELL